MPDNAFVFWSLGRGKGGFTMLLAVLLIVLLAVIAWNLFP